MKYFDIIQRHNLSSLSQSAVMKMYQSIITHARDNFQQQLSDVLENKNNFIVINGIGFTGLDVRQYFNGVSEEEATYGRDALGNDVGVFDLGEEINAHMEQLDVLDAFLNTIGSQVNNISEAITQFGVSITNLDLSSSKGHLLFQYCNDILTKSGDTSTALQSIISTITVPNDSSFQTSEVFEATGTNPSILLLNSLDFPELSFDNFFESIVAMDQALLKIKAKAKLTLINAIRTGVNTLNTTFVDTIDAEVLTDYEDLSCLDSFITLRDAVTLSNLSTRDGTALDILRETLQSVESQGNTLYAYVIPTIGASLYVVCNKQSTSWTVNYYLKKHIYNADSATRLLGVLTTMATSILNPSDDVFKHTLMNAVGSNSLQPTGRETDIDYEKNIFNGLLATERLICAGLVLVAAGSDDSVGGSLLRQWYNIDASTYLYDAASAFSNPNYSVQGPSTITNRTWYDEVNYVNTSLLTSNGFPMDLLINTMNALAPGSKLSSELTTIDGTSLKASSFEVNDFLSGVLKVKSDAQLVIELKTILGITAATIAAIGLAVVGVKLRSVANTKYLTYLRDYRTLLANPEATASDLATSFRKVNRWSRITSPSLRKSSSGWFVSAPSMNSFSQGSELKDIRLDISSLDSKVSLVKSTAHSIYESVLSSKTTLSSVYDIVRSTLISQIDGVNTKVQSLANKLNSIEDKIDNNNSSSNSTLTEVSGDINVVLSDLSSLKTTVQGISTDISTANSTISTIQSNLSSVDSTLSSVTSEISNLSTAATNIRSDVSDVNSAVSTVDTKVANLSTDTANIQSVLSNVSGQLSTESTGVISNLTTVIEGQTVLTTALINSVKDIIK